MKNNLFFTYIFFSFFLTLKLIAQDLEINSEKIKYDNVNKITILEGSVTSEDELGNKIFSNYAKYNKLKGLIETKGETKIVTSAGFKVLTSNVIFDDKKKLILSNNKTKITDKDGNKILVDMFNYSILTNIFFSKGNIEILDVNNNSYNFSEIYIDENKKKIIGSDIKAFLKQSNILENNTNEPRFFANTMSLSNNINTLEKGIFTYCKKRENDKCPPWTLQSEKIQHDLAKKTIYYDNVVLKIYDFPIFYAPKFSHPDPTVDRRSGILSPSLTSSSTLGSGFSLPYFWNIGGDQDLTVTPKVYLNENPLILAEYRKDFKDSFLIVDAGYTQGYKKKDSKKTSGGRAHFFANFNKNIINDGEKNSDIEVNIEKLSNDTYLKVHDVNTSLVNSKKEILESSVKLTYQNEDFYIGLTPSAYEDINKEGNLRHEYLLPLTVEKNLMSSNKYGFADIESNIRMRNYDINKQTNFFVNDFNWKSNKWLNKLGFENYFESQVKTVNYEADNTDEFKNENSNSELHSVLGYFTKLGLYKKDFTKKNLHTLTPKILLRYAPGHMRNVKSGRLNYGNLFTLNKINKLDVIESGLSTSIGFDYKKNKLNKKNNIGQEVFSFSVGQVISDRENLDMPSSSSLGQKFSDIVGETTYNFNEKINLNYNFSVDQGYKRFNYNEIEAGLNYEKVKFDISYLEEQNHIGNQELIGAGMSLNLNESSALSFSTKRNILTSSSEFYNLSYDYINDCLKAGIAFRREFYTDRDVEPNNSLMFTISIIPFADIKSPSLIK